MDQTKEIQDLKREIASIRDTLNHHKHDGADGSSKLLYNIDLKAEQTFSVGNIAKMTGETDPGTGSTTLKLISGNDSTLADGQQVTSLYLAHDKATDTTATVAGTNDSFFYGTNGPFFEGATGSIVSGQSTLSQTDWQFTPDVLVGAYLVAYNNSFSGNSLITANDKTSVTISGTWLTTASNMNYIIFVPVYLGADLLPWRKIFVLGGDGGIVFGFRSNSGQLYMNSDGTPHWIDTSGVDHQLRYV